MYIVVIGWIYVVLMMAIAESSVIAGIMTFLMYGVLPLTIILYLSGGRRRGRNRESAKKSSAVRSGNSDIRSGAHTGNDNADTRLAEQSQAEEKQAHED